MANLQQRVAATGLGLAAGLALDVDGVVGKQRRPQARVDAGHAAELAGIGTDQRAVDHVLDDGRDQAHAQRDDHRSRREARAVAFGEIVADVLHVDEEGLVQAEQVHEVDDVGLGDGAAMALERDHRAVVFAACVHQVTLK